MKRLLVRCDDFGSAPGANKAILQLAESGLTLNVSVMVCGPEGNKDLKALAQFAPRVALGIHAAVNAEWDTIKWGPVGDKASVRLFPAHAGERWSIYQSKFFRKRGQRFA